MAKLKRCSAEHFSCGSMEWYNHFHSSLSLCWVADYEEKRNSQLNLDLPRFPRPFFAGPCRRTAHRTTPRSTFTPEFLLWASALFQTGYACLNDLSTHAHWSRCDLEYRHFLDMLSQGCFGRHFIQNVNSIRLLLGKQTMFKEPSKNQVKVYQSERKGPNDIGYKVTITKHYDRKQISTDTHDSKRNRKC